MVYGCSVSPHLLVLHVHCFQHQGVTCAVYYRRYLWKPMPRDRRSLQHFKCLLYWIICLKIRFKGPTTPSIMVKVQSSKMFLNLPGCQFWLILCRHLWTHRSFLRYSLRQDTGTIEKKALMVLQYILRCPEIRGLKKGLW